MLKNPELFVSANILVSKNTETGTNESTISKNNVSVSFIKDGVQQSVLKSGKAYSITAPFKSTDSPNSPSPAIGEKTAELFCRLARKLNGLKTAVTPVLSPLTVISPKLTLTRAVSCDSFTVIALLQCLGFFY